MYAKINKICGSHMEGIDCEKNNSVIEIFKLIAVKKYFLFDCLLTMRDKIYIFS